jgi:hypothetical protein
MRNISLVDAVNAGFRQKRGMVYIICMSSRRSLEKHLRIGTPNGSMGQTSFAKVFFLSFVLLVD